MQNVLMDVNSMALLNCFEAFADPAKDETSVLLDIGKNFTNLIIVSDTAPPFVRSINSAGKDIIRQIANELGTSDDSVEEMLKQKDSTEINRQEFNVSLASALLELADQVQETFAYYRTHQQQCLISKVYICGGFALGAKVEEILNSQLLETVQVWNPLEKIPFNQDGSETCPCIENGPAMAVALGLAMRSI
jgi:type IV pilus assembly protein PilM